MIVEKRFDVAEDGHGRLLLVLSVHEGAPSESAVLHYAGGAEAVLERAPGQRIHLPNLHPDAVPRLIGRGRVIVLETSDGVIRHSYEARVTAAAGAEETLPPPGLAPVPRQVTVQTAHDLMINAEGAPALVIEASAGEPDAPVLRWQPGRAALYRQGLAGRQVVVLPGLNAEAPAHLAARARILVIEMAGEEISRQYEARLEAAGVAEGR